MAKKKTPNRKKSSTKGTAAKKTIQQKGDVREIHSGHSDEVTKEITQDMFESRWKLFFDEFQKLVEEHKIPVALGFIVDPELDYMPITFSKGDLLSQGKAANMMMSGIRSRIEEELTGAQGRQKGPRSQ